MNLTYAEFLYYLLFLSISTALSLCIPGWGGSCLGLGGV